MIVGAKDAFTDIMRTTQSRLMSNGCVRFATENATGNNAMQLDFFPDLPRRLAHDEILAGFAELLRAVEAMEFWQPHP